MVTPGAMTVLGTPVDLGARRASTATSSPASTDHIIPWENAYRSTQLLGGDVALRALHQRPHPGARQPAGEQRARASASRREPADAEAWSAQRHAPGSWWPDYDAWLAERSGALDPRTASPAAAPRRPGTYVHAN